MQARAPRGCSFAPERCYVGRRPAHTEVYVVDRYEVKPLAHLCYRSEATFDWGGSTEGTLELAFAILADATQSQPTDLVCRTFCAEVIAPLNPAGFVLGHGDIALWLLTAIPDGPSGRPAPVPRVGLRRRAANWIRARVRGR
jgi:hypothetical protein